MLTLATNLLLWLLAVTNDSMHHEIESELNTLVKKFSGTKGTHPWLRTTHTHTHTHTHHTCYTSSGVPFVVQRLTNPTRIHEVVGSIPGLTQLVEDLVWL